MCAGDGMLGQTLQGIKGIATAVQPVVSSISGGPIGAALSLASMVAAAKAGGAAPNPVASGVASAPASQAAQTPDQSATRRATGGGVSGMDTQLTGPGGVANSLLALGKNTLLGQ